MSGVWSALAVSAAALSSTSSRVALQAVMREIAPAEKQRAAH